MGDFVDLRDHLLAVWDPSYRPLRYLRERGNWTIGLSPAFRKAIGSVDKKLQGRILEAIAGISEDPLTAQGDTKKPLEGNLKGLWRYRIGEFRLIYRPENAASVVVLVDFVARSAGYSGVGD
nr:type II toxin-antitoxin system RelE/ParE family toxin [Burkholderia ambifaria]